MRPRMKFIRVLYFTDARMRKYGILRTRVNYSLETKLRAALSDFLQSKVPVGLHKLIINARIYMQ